MGHKKRPIQRHTITTVKESKHSIWLIGGIDTRHCLSADRFGVKRLRFRKTCRMLNISIDVPIILVFGILVVSIMCIKLGRVFSLLDLSGCENSKHGHLDLTSGLGGLIVIRRPRV